MRVAVPDQTERDAPLAHTDHYHALVREWLTVSIPSHRSTLATGALE